MEDYLFSLCQDFRNAIEKTDKALLPITFADFPHGSCGDASLLLARFLREQGYRGFKYKLGYLGPANNESSHAWLQRDLLIADITGDQFRDFGRPVFVGQRSLWHDQLRLSERHDDQSDYRKRKDDKDTVATLDRAYRAITQHLH